MNYSILIKTIEKSLIFNRMNNGFIIQMMTGGEIGAFIMIHIQEINKCGKLLIKLITNNFLIEI